MTDTFEMTGNTAILLVDPYKDFLHPEGKSYGLLDGSLAETDTSKHLHEMGCRRSQAPHPDLLRLAPTAQSRLHGGLESTQRPSSCLKRKAVRSWRIPGGTVIYGRLGPDLTDENLVVSKHWCSR